MIFLILSIVGIMSVIVLHHIVTRSTGRDTWLFSSEEPTYVSPTELRGDTDKDDAKAIRLNGLVKFPLHSYKDDSSEVQLKLNKTHIDEWSVLLSKAHGATNFVTFLVPYDSMWIEVELQAPAMKIDGTNPVRIHISDAMDFRWIVHFTSSGNQIIQMLVRVGTAKTPPRQVGFIKKSMKVYQIDGLVQRQVWIITVGIGILTVISTVLTILLSLHQLGIISPANFTPTP